MRTWLVAVISTLLLSACVPRAGNDTLVVSPAIAPAVTEPTIRAERVFVAEPPSWSPANVTRNARQVPTSEYIVRTGDSLLLIAYRTGAGASAIAKANALKPPYNIRPETRLQIPGGLYHRVGVGETGIAIARAYRTSWTEIVRINALRSPYTLQAGQNLLLSSNAVVDKNMNRSSPEVRAAAFSIDIDDIVTGGNIVGTGSVPPATGARFAGRFAWPLRGAIVGRFGAQGGGRVNDGVNIASENGTVVRAAAPGVVVYSGNEIGVFGGLVLIDHGEGWVTAYGHLGSLDVAKGDRVSTGQVIGGVGETGYVRQPQLHFQIRKDRQAVNPLNVLERFNG